MKRIISLVLVLGMWLSMSVAVFAFATSKDTKIDSIVETKVTANSTSKLICATEKSAAPQLFRDDANIDIYYAYTVDDIRQNDKKVRAEMNITLNINNETVYIPVVGDLDIYTLISGVKYISGPLDGEVTIAGTTFKVIAGFQKFVGNDDVKVGVTLSAVDNSIPTMYYYFGDLYVDPVVIEEVFASDNNYVFEGESSNMPSRNVTDNGDNNNETSFTIIAQEAMYIDDASAGTLFLSLNRNDSIIMAGVTPNIESMREHFNPVVGNFGVGVNRITVGIDQREDSDMYFNGISYLPEELDRVSWYYTIDAQMAVDLIKEIINLHPMGPLLGEVGFALFENLLIELSVTADLVDTSQSIETTWNLGCIVDNRFDDVPFTVSAEVKPNAQAPSYPSARINSYASIRYRFDQTIPASGSITYYEESDTVYYSIQIMFMPVQS